MESRFDQIRAVKGRKLGCFLSCTLTMLQDEADWLYHIYGGLVDVSMRSLREGAEYSTLTEMYLEELLGGVARNAWWYSVRLLGNDDLRRITTQYGSVPFSVPLESVRYRGDLFPDSLVMGVRMHVFILCADGQGGSNILDPRVGSVHQHIRTPLDLPAGKSAIRFPCDGYVFDWHEFVRCARALGERRLLGAKREFARSILASQEQITSAKADQMRELIVGGAFEDALAGNLFHPVMTARQVSFDDDQLWGDDAAVKQAAAVSTQTLYALQLRVSGALLGRDNRQMALAMLASLETAERDLALTCLGIAERW